MSVLFLKTKMKQTNKQKPFRNSSSITWGNENERRLGQSNPRKSSNASKHLVQKTSFIFLQGLYIFKKEEKK